MRWPASIGRYEVQGLLGTGGTAEVLRGIAVRPDGGVDEVAIKRPLAEQALDPSAAARIRAEARILSLVRHEHVVAFIELIDGETPALVLERLHGRTLADVRVELTWPAVLAIGAQAAAALASVHVAADEAGPLHAVHGDVSPENLFVTVDGSIRLFDFNVARYRGGLSATGALQGRVAYMAPEQARGQSVDGRADVFALATVLWERLAGERLFWRGNTLATLRAIVDEVAPPIASRRPRLPAGIDALLAEALDPEPGRRPDATTLHERLRALVAEGPGPRAELARLAR